MFSDPIKNVEQFELEKGMKVADLGSGSGFYTIAVAQAVGGEGRVYSVDVQKDLLDKIRNQATLRHLRNIEIVWGNMEKIGGTRLRADLLDRVIISNTLFQVADKDSTIEEAKRILRKNGRLLVIDWEDSFGGLGPQPKDVLNRIEAEKLLTKHGLVFEREITAGDHHYGLIFRKVN